MLSRRNPGRGTSAGNRAGERTLVVALAIGAALLIWTLGKGNQQILALPLAYWLAVLLWPKPSGRLSMTPREGPTAFRQTRKMLLMGAVICTWLPVGVRITPLLFTGAPSRSELIRALDEADALAKRGRPSEAITRLRTLEIPDQFPLEKARRHHNLGMLLFFSGKHTEAAEHLRRSLALDSRNAQAMHGLALIASQEGRASEAVELETAALEIDPDFTPAAELLNRLQQRMVSP